MMDYDGAAEQLKLHGIYRAGELVSRFKEGGLTPEEGAELEKWLAQDERHRVWFDRLLKSAHLIEEQEDFKTFTAIRPEELLRVMAEAGIEHPSRVYTRKRIGLAASVLVIILGLGSFYIYRLRETKPVTPVVAAVKNDIAPGGNKATLTLGDGRVISLDNAGNGFLATQGKGKIVKVADGELSYSNEQGKPKDIIYNTLTTPVAGKFQIVLSDGTKVWLNSSSSLVYPSVFEGKERTVTLNGEGYFEVAANKSMPFIVKVGESNSIKVLGTHFDVMAYSDEPVMRTTLLEGSVSVQSGGASGLLKPGEKAEVPSRGIVTITRSEDVSEAVAWKEGLFQFNHADLQTILRQISRWYGVTVVYKDVVHTEALKGMAPRNVNLSKLLEGISGMTGVHFTLNGNQLIVSNE